MSQTAENPHGGAAPAVDDKPHGLAIWLLIAVVTAAGLALAALGGWHWHDRDLAAILILVLVAMAAERSDFNLYDNINVSLAFVPMFAIMVLGGMWGLALVVPLAVLASAVGVERPFYKTAFNFGALMIAGTATVLVFHVAGTTSDVEAWPAVLFVAILAALVNYAINGALVAAAVGLSTGVSIRKIWVEHCMWLWPHYLVLGVLGLAIASAYSAIGVWGILVFLFPPLTMRLSLKQYLDRTTKGVLDLREAHGELQTAHGELTSALSDLDRAYDGTLRALVSALDARDSETGGHSTRVADLTAAIAEEMGIPRDSEQGKIIAWGALLHDVGKIAVPDAILRKPGKLSDDEWDAMRTHARAGYDIIRSVEFLAPASQIVLAHHERYDGGGYPRGLAGEEIPRGARIFMIADTFDAITSKRPYKAALPAEEALAEILRHSGTQFDPACVEAFLAVYRKRFVPHPNVVAASRKRADRMSLPVERALAEAVAGFKKSA